MMFRKFRNSRTYIVIISITAFAESKLYSILSNTKYLIENKNLSYKIHWIFPTYFFEILKLNPELNEWFFNRLKNNEDIYIPSTYSGSPHEYMLHDEIHVDLYWSLKNPFKSGYKDLFKDNPHTFYVYNMEKLRKRVLELYRKLNFNYIEGIRIAKNNKKYLVFYKNNCQFLSEIQEPETQKQNIDTLIYFHEIKDIYNNQELKNFLLSLKGLDANFYSIKIQNLEGKKITTELLEIPEFNSLKEQAIILQFQNKRLKEYQINEISLKEFLVNKNFEYHSTNLEPITSKNIEYNMEGNFTLSHEKYHVKFEEGKLNKIKYKERKAEFLDSCRTYIKILSQKDIIIEPTIESSFSFSNEKIVGIRQYLNFNTKEKSIIDFFLDENLASFFISIKIAWPSVITCNNKSLKLSNTNYLLEYSSLEIPIFEVEKGTNLKITAKYNDFDTYEKIIETKKDIKGYINGTEFLISKGNDQNSNFFISFLNIEKHIIYTINYKIAKRGFKRWFILNIGGSYNTIKAEDLKNYSLSLNLLLLPINNNFDNKIKINSKIKTLLFYPNIKKNENK
ncbi:serine/threonine kinase, putative [Borrelia turicatae 91E135]|uniref:Serine/threonine kinase, putative n=2 Tax=Borrelia turicatae TaxID=142 RepID=A0ABF7PW13_BORT9|nr:serine/threonine kinase, putative [Borrelia turicatae 91E135]